MKTLLAKVVSADDSPVDMQQRLGEFALQTYSPSRPSLDVRHLSFISSTFHEIHTLFTSITENDPRRLFLVQLCSTLSEYYFNRTMPADDDPDTIASIAYCRDAWLRFLAFARVDTPTPDLALMACIWKVSAPTSMIDQDPTCTRPSRVSVRCIAASLPKTKPGFQRRCTARSKRQLRAKSLASVRNSTCSRSPHPTT